MDLKTLLFSFEGRIGRQQYILGTLGMSLGSGFLIGVLSGIFIAMHAFALAVILALLLLIPTIWAQFALLVKRVQDRDHDWYFLLISLIPFIGGLWLFVETWFLRGTEGGNRFGKDPVA
jgi:uncharacterized membrane protein YhaH (DUF805 family)